MAERNGSPSSPYERHNVEFPSSGVVIRGWLYLPTTTTPCPGLVVSHGFAFVKEIFGHHDYPAVFASADLR